MPITNAEIAEILREYADLLEIKGANEFRIRAYRTAARNIDNLTRSVAQMVSTGEDLSTLPGIGQDLATKAAEIVRSGRLPELEQLKKEIPSDLIGISRLAGLGPKRTGALHRELGITRIDQLEEAVQQQKVRLLPGFGARTEQRVAEDLSRERDTPVGSKRYRLSVMEEIAQPLIEYLSAIDGVRQVTIAGSYRRKKETVKDLDILVTHHAKCDVMQWFVEYEDVEDIVSQGDTRSAVRLRYGVQVDLRAVPQNSYGAALHYFTGSKAHNIAVRRRGVQHGLKINEYGVFHNGKRIAGETEEEVYATVHLDYVEPELRENTGEIEAAGRGTLPGIVKPDDIRGDLHTHTKATDGRATLREMADAARQRGYEYLAITEHSRHVTVAGGLDASAVEQQIAEIDQLNEQLDDLVLLKGIEVDILEDGTLDLPDEILKKLDLVVCAVHYKLDLPAEKQTERIIRGISNSYPTILAHPTGRIIGRRRASSLDMERLMRAAKQTDTILELNAQPDRLDLTEVHARMAKEMGVMVAISTDAHSGEELNFMRLGVFQARRGWIEPGDVLNTKNHKGVKDWLSRKRK